jgi:hypothetical protein
MSVHERATKSDERTTTNGEDILRSEESADEKGEEDGSIPA